MQPPWVHASLSRIGMKANLQQTFIVNTLHVLFEGIDATELETVTFTRPKPVIFCGEINNSLALCTLILGDMKYSALM